MITTRRRVLIGTATSATALAVALTGCSAGSSSSSDAKTKASTSANSSAAATLAATSSAASSAASSGSSGSSSGGNSSSGKDLAVCSVLPPAKAGQIVGKSFTSTKARGVSGVVASCEYQADTDLLFVTVDLQLGKHAFDTQVEALSAVGHAPTKISGVGDEAFDIPDPAGNAGGVGAAASGGYGAVFGDVYIQVGGLYVTPDQGRQIVEAVHAAM